MVVPVTRLLPYRLLSEIAPLAIPARLRTAVSPSEIAAVLARPSSTFTADKEIAPEDGSVMRTAPAF
jgi:hypothetical protein